LAKIPAKVRDSLPGTIRTTYLVLAEVSPNKFTTIFKKGKSDGKKIFTPLEEKHLWEVVSKGDPPGRPYTWKKSLPRAVLE